MPITNDIRAYADSALEQGKHVVGQASAQFNDLTGTARTNVTELRAKATGAVHDLRVQAEKAINIDALRTAVEPYLAQAKQYRASVTDRAEGLVDSVKADKRVAKVVATAESLTGAVNERVVKPVSSLTGRASKPSAKTAATKPATTRPAANTAAAETAAVKAPAVKAPAKKAATARKAPAVKPTES